MTNKIWELDFYSRPILDENNKKVWEVLICETPLEIKQSPDSLFRYSQFCPNATVNSIWLKEAIEKALAQAEEAPQKIRFFRRSMNNMISKACEELGISAALSRRTYALNQWLEDRMTNFYPNQPGYAATAAPANSLQYPEINPVSLPDAIKGDRTDKWALVSLAASAFEEMNEWEISFGEAFPLALAGVTPQMQIPGLIIFSARGLPLAGWMSGLEMGFLHFQETPRPSIRLEAGVSESWILANITDSQTLTEAKGFEQAKQNAQNVHFLAIQSSPDSEEFAGFWLLKRS